MVLVFGLWHHLMDIYQVCSNNAPGPKMGPPWGHVLHRRIYGKYENNLIGWNHKAWSLDIWYVALTSRPLPRVF